MRALRLTLLALAISSPLASAGVADDMDSFFNGTINVTDPGVANSQMGGLYTAGSLSLRTPSRTINPVQLNLPSFSGGCNGIDVFAGAFSHISSEQLTALGKAIASNAGPFAFDLAVSTLSPVIQNAYEKLRRLANMINQFQINSCEQASALVANAWPFETNKAVTRSVCNSLGQRRGMFTDAAAAKYNCDNQGMAPGVAASARNDPEYRDVFKDNTNSTWSALNKSNFVTDDEMKRLIMTLVGTVVNKAATTESGNPKFDYVPAKGGDDNFLSAFLNGGTVKIHQCTDTSSCLNIQKGAQSVTIPIDKSFVSMVGKMINELQTIARSQSDALTDKHKGFLNRTTLPIYKMILVDLAYSRGSSSIAAPENYAEIVAIDYFYNYINGLIESTFHAVNQEYASSAEPSIKAWREDLQRIQRKLQQRIADQKDTMTAHQQMMEKTMQLEKMVAADISNQVIAAFEYSKKL
ncbi:conjugal transfer protein TraH [Vibrio mediterranei]|uniref:conjugal transfer protein TraH n=1 Tax=Vibrio mediterranei TaxID=689 RepID=UPI001EFD74C8|nr:conjugal transfer protein TraH [Vibrio mediterranei]MCG9658861.1 conjugal transfer protein TraH [Vibrio mediterranei]